MRVEFVTLPADIFLAVYGDRPLATPCAMCFMKRARRAFNIKERHFWLVVRKVGRIVKARDKVKGDAEENAGAKTQLHV